MNSASRSHLAKPGGRKPFLGCLLLILAALSIGCRGPNLDLKGTRSAPEVALTIKIEDHSRNLKRLRDLQSGDANSPEERLGALEQHRASFEEGFRGMAEGHGLKISPSASWRLELTITSLGEIRSRYLFYGIASGVAWGVGTGLVAHNTTLALGLGGYELLEESAFWLLGAGLFGSYSAPAVVEAHLIQSGQTKAAWSETYFVLNGRKRLKTQAPGLRHRREVQLQASLDKVLDKIFHDLEPVLAFAKEVGPAPSP